MTDEATISTEPQETLEPEAPMAEDEVLQQMAEQAFGGGMMGGPREINRNFRIALPRLSSAVGGRGPVLSASIHGTESDLDINVSVDADGRAVEPQEYEEIGKIIRQLI